MNSYVSSLVTRVFFFFNWSLLGWPLLAKWHTSKVHILLAEANQVGNQVRGCHLLPRSGCCQQPYRHTCKSPVPHLRTMLVSNTPWYLPGMKAEAVVVSDFRLEKRGSGSCSHLLCRGSRPHAIETAAALLADKLRTCTAQASEVEWTRGKGLRAQHWAGLPGLVQHPSSS